MKKQLIAFMLITVLVQSNAFASSFNRRWGANSPITNIPLFFKQNQYKGGCGDCNKGTSRRVTNQVRKMQTQSECVAAPARRQQVAQRMNKQNNQPMVVAASTTTRQPSRRQTRKLATAKYQSMQTQQSELEMEKNRLKKELQELEMKKMNFAKA